MKKLKFYQYGFIDSYFIEFTVTEVRLSKYFHRIYLNYCSLILFVLLHIMRLFVRMLQNSKAVIFLKENKMKMHFGICFSKYIFMISISFYQLGFIDSYVIEFAVMQVHLRKYFRLICLNLYSFI